MDKTCQKIMLGTLLAGSLGSGLFAAEINGKTAEKIPSSVPASGTQKTKKTVPVRKTVPVGKTVPVVTEKSSEYSVPILSVSGKEKRGKISYVPLRFTRSQKDHPLRIMISDDTPNGSGESLRSSIWLAALTAAMLRNDTMHGVTISAELSGSCDGPSGGGVMCLAILSAMDGLPLPKDFAMTGSILPDGSIGIVGGIPEKMTAAAKSGAKRIVVPAFVRMCRDGNGKNVDLSRLADELKVKLVRVNSIPEAYALVHGKPYQEETYVNLREMTRLPRKMEDMLLSVYHKLHQEISAELKKKPDWKDLPPMTDHDRSLDEAKRYYQEGQLLPAVTKLYRSRQELLAHQKTMAFASEFRKKCPKAPEGISILREYHLRKSLSLLRKAVEKKEKALWDENRKKCEERCRKMFKKKDVYGFFPFAKGLTEITAQLESVSGHTAIISDRDNINARRLSAEKISHASAKELEKAWQDELYHLLCIFMLTADETRLDDFLGKFGKEFPQLRPNKHAPDVEKLLYSSVCGTYSTARKNFHSVLKSMSRSEGRRKEEFREEVQRNPLIAYMHVLLDSSMYMHSLLTPDSEKKPLDASYHIQGAIKEYVKAFSAASAVFIMYEPELGNDSLIRFKRNARNAAIRNISECVKAKIPCLPAICTFEQAESSFSENELINLIFYWRASLYAKTLLMSFNSK